MTGWTENGLLQAWRALAQQKAEESWRLVHLASLGAVSIQAGCHFPLTREALIISFPESWSVNPARLPKGKGFDVTWVQGQTGLEGRTAIALVRRPEGSPDIFAVMVVDVLRTLEAATTRSNSDVVKAFIERVKEWQAFMARTHRPLTPEAQIGLFGELWLLNLLVEILGPSALDTWQGPLRAAQDFHIGAGAVEVKSTVRKNTFLARINSIEQLDSERSPIFLCALRFEETGVGVSLVGLVSELRSAFELAGVRRGFEGLLLVIGYLDEHADVYCRTLAMRDAKVFRVEADMPRLKRAELPAAFRSASYVLDLDALEVPYLMLVDLISELGLD
jgi:Putative  PD-(D/E)XK family member, (DUF4420)